jgi:DMSO/TMAO reductase YedYZ heme-binding membrane subunit
MRLLLILMGFRRELGILMGFLATVHTLGYFFDPAFMMRMILSHSSAWWGMDWRILSGLLAYALTLPLLLTSNSWSQRLLAQNWKRLHRLAYPLLLFVLIHKFVFAGTLTVANVGGVLGGLVVFGVYCGVRFLANHPEKFPLMQTLILWVSRQYQSYRTTL